MIILDSATKSLELVLDSNIATHPLEWTASFIQIDDTCCGSITAASCESKIESNGTVSGSTPVTIVTPPPIPALANESITRKIIFISGYNADTAVVNMTLQIDDGSVKYRIVTFSLDPGFSFIYNEDEISVYDTRGGIVTVVYSVGGLTGILTPTRIPYASAPGILSDSWFERVPAGVALDSGKFIQSDIPGEGAIDFSNNGVNLSTDGGGYSNTYFKLQPTFIDIFGPSSSEIYIDSTGNVSIIGGSFFTLQLTNLQFICAAAEFNNAPLTQILSLAGAGVGGALIDWDTNSDKVRLYTDSGAGATPYLILDPGTFSGTSSAVLSTPDGSLSINPTIAVLGHSTLISLSAPTTQFNGGDITDINNADISGTVNIASLTPSELVATDASKNLVSVTTPTLSQLAFVDATSSIQTQLNNKQPLDADLTAIAALTTDAFGRGLLTQTTAANVRSYIGAGTGSGTVTSVSGTANRITSTGGNTPVIDIASTYAGQSSITTVGTVTGGTWSSLVVLPGTASPAYTQGKLVYDIDNESLTFFNNDSNISLQIGQESWIRVVNNTGSTIANGVPVYISGTSATLPTIALAKADSATTVICAGLTTEAIPNGGTGYVTNIGVVHSVDTSAFSVGATVFVSATTAGALTTTAPVSPNYRFRIGIVVVSNATTGSILVTPSTGALGNGTANQLLSINSAGTAQAFRTVSDIAITAGLTVQDSNFLIQDNLDTTKLVNFQASGLTTGTTRTLTIQDKNITVAGIDDVYFTLSNECAAFGAADATTYLFGSVGTAIAAGTAANTKQSVIPFNCTLIGYAISARNSTTTATTEASTVSFRLNNTTDTQLSNAVLFSGTAPVCNTYSGSSLAVNITAGDTFETKWLTPTWATNPGGSQIQVTYYFKRR